MMKKVLAVLLVAFLVALAGTALAGPGGRGMGMGMGMRAGYGMGPYAYAPTNLTPEKAAQLQTLRETFLKEVTPLQSDLFAKKSELRVLWANANPDGIKISALQKDMLSLQGKLQEKRLQYNLDTSKLINQ